jgi:hypothetical protein
MSVLCANCGLPIETTTWSVKGWPPWRHTDSRRLRCVATTVATPPASLSARTTPTDPQGHS